MEGCAKRRTPSKWGRLMEGMETMRKLLPALALAALLGGCKTGYLIDRFGDREDVLAPQLARFGMSAQETTCVSQLLGRRLSLVQLRSLEIRARAVTQGLSDPARLTMNDLIIAANGLNDPEVRGELDNAASTCGVRPATLSVASAVRAAPAPVPVAGALPTTGPAEAGTGGLSAGRVLTGPDAEAIFAGRAPAPGSPSGGTLATSGAASGAAMLNPLWLNLGSAGSGQSISIDGASVEREEDARTAWFRMVDPDATPSLTWYRLRVECSGRTVQPVARRRVDAEGRELEHQVYPENYERPAAIEAGTVTEIAWLSLCT